MQASRLDGVLPLKRQLQLLSLPPAKKRRVLALAGRKLQKMTRDNIRGQRDIYGKSFVKRTDKDRAAKRRRKLLRKMGRQLTQKATPKQVEVGFKGIAGHIAAKHQHGSSQKVTAQGFKYEMKKRERGRQYYDAPATKQQAYTLVKDLGYKRGTRGGKTMRVSHRWIRSNMTIAHAGMVIAQMREAKGLAKRSADTWLVKTPERAFFGATAQVASDMATELFEQETVRQLAL